VCTDKAYLSTDEYALAKARQEDMLEKSERKNWTIVRPYITYSEQRLQLGTLEKEHWLFRALRGRTIVFCKELRSKLTTLTYGRDVALGIRAVIGNPHAPGQSFNVTGDDPITWDEVLDVYLDVLEGYLGARPKVLFQDLDDFCCWRPSSYQVVYDRLYNRVFDPSKRGAYLGVGGLVSAKVGLKQCLEAFLSSPSFRDIDGSSEAFKDIATKERTAINEIPNIKQKVKYLVRRNAPIKT
jgi:nucleoside-diphosphate-sugar epimerase